MSHCVETDHYVYADSGTLINKAGLQDSAALKAFEADVTAVRMLELLERPVRGRFDLAHLQAIHRHIFQDVYEWAGELRNVDVSREGSYFGNWTLIGNYLEGQLGRLRQENLLHGLAPQAFAGRLAWYLAEINAAHPFREGNGHSQRLFCLQLAQQAGYFVDLHSLQHNEMYAAMKASFNGDLAPLTALLGRITLIIG